MKSTCPRVIVRTLRSPVKKLKSLDKSPSQFFASPRFAEQGRSWVDVKKNMSLGQLRVLVTSPLEFSKVEHNEVEESIVQYSSIV